MLSMDDSGFRYGRIKAISGHPMSGLWSVHFEDGDVAYLDSGIGARILARHYGSLGEAIGRDIYYKTDDLGVMECFRPINGD